MSPSESVLCNFSLCQCTYIIRPLGNRTYTTLDPSTPTTRHGPIIRRKAPFSFGRAMSTVSPITISRPDIQCNFDYHIFRSDLSVCAYIAEIQAFRFRANLYDAILPSSSLSIPSSALDASSTES